MERSPIDFGEALRQHERYEAALEAGGCRVVRLPPIADLPDSCFPEDAAVGLADAVVLCRPGAPERRPEVDALERALRGDEAGPSPAGDRPLLRLEAPARLDGGDVVRMGRRLVVGLSGRTDEAGVSALASRVEPLGYRVEAVRVEGALHLESVATAVEDDVVLVDPARVDAGVFAPARVLEVHPDEPLGANVARTASGALVASASAPRTVERLRGAGYEVLAVPLSEFEKAEGAATCLSLRIPG